MSDDSSLGILFCRGRIGWDEIIEKLILQSSRHCNQFLKVSYFVRSFPCTVCQYGLLSQYSHISRLNSYIRYKSLLCVVSPKCRCHERTATQHLLSRRVWKRNPGLDLINLHRVETIFDGRALSMLSLKVLLLPRDCCLSVYLPTATVSSPSTTIDLVQPSPAYVTCQPSFLCDWSFQGIGVRSLWRAHHQLLPCASCPQSLAAFVLQNRCPFSTLILRFSPPRSVMVRSSLSWLRRRLLYPS